MTATTENLKPAPAGNTRALKHGIYSRRALAQRGTEIAEALMAAPHTVPLDAIAAQEIGALLALVERVDMALVERGVTGNKTLLDLRLRASGRLQRWLDGFGATPASRAAWAESVARGGLAAEIARRRADSESEAGE